MPLLWLRILNSTFSSKLAGFPPSQMRKVLCGAEFSLVVCPTMAPSSTDQNFGLPSQPSRDSPSKMRWNPSSDSPAARPVDATARRAAPSPSRIAPLGNRPSRMDNLRLVGRRDARRTPLGAASVENVSVTHRTRFAKGERPSAAQVRMSLWDLRELRDVGSPLVPCGVGGGRRNAPGGPPLDLRGSPGRATDGPMEGPRGRREGAACLHPPPSPAIHGLGHGDGLELLIGRRPCGPASTSCCGRPT